MKKGVELFFSKELNTYLFPICLFREPATVYRNATNSPPVINASTHQM